MEERRDPLATTLCALIVVGVAVAQLWPGLSAGLSPPISWDHGSHIGKAILTAEQLLPWLRGWTDSVEAGVPLGTVYTPVGTLWILLFRVFTTQLEWHQTYAIAFAGFRAMVGLSAMRLARAAGAGHLGGLAAALMALADRGDHSEGGWFYDVEFGVWPMSLAMAFFFFGVGDLLSFLSSGRRALGVRSMLWLGAALFSHQMSLIAVCVLLPPLVLVRAVEHRAELRRDLSRLIGVLAVAGMLAAWWMLPMLGLSEWLDDHGQLYQSAPEIGARLVLGEPILHGGPWTSVLVSLALGMALFSRGHARILALTAMLAMLVSSPWMVSLDAARWMPSVGRIVYPRLIMVAKPILFALAGLLVHLVIARIGPELRRGMATWSGRAGLVLTLCLCAPFSRDVPNAVYGALIAREVTTTASLRDWPHWQDLWHWVEGLPRDRFFRVFYWNDSSHLAQASAGYTGRGSHVTGVLVGEAFSNTTDSTDPEALRELNVRYVALWGGPHGALRGAVSSEPVETFGPIRVYELTNWSDRVVIPADGESGSPVLRALEHERVVFEPGGAREVVVRRARSPHWRAYADGVEIPIGDQRVVDSPRLRLMRLSIPEGTQRVEVVYAGLGARGWLGGLASWLGLLVVFAYGLWAYWPARLRASVVARRDALIARVPPWLMERWPALVLGAPFLLGAAIVVRGTSGWHLAYHIDEMRLAIERADGTVEECTDPRPEGGVQCASAAHVGVGRTSMCIDGRFHSCMTAHPPPDGTLVMEWPQASLGSTLSVGGGISDDTHAGGRGAHVEVRVLIDGEERGVLDVPNGRAWVAEDVATEPGTHAVRFEIRAPEPDHRWLCVDAIAR